MEVAAAWNDGGMMDISKLTRKEAEDEAVKQFTRLYNNTNERDIDMSKLEFIIRNAFGAGVYYEKSILLTV